MIDNPNELDQDELLRRGIHPAQLAGLIPAPDSALPPPAPSEPPPSGPAPAGSTADLESKAKPLVAPMSAEPPAQQTPSRLTKMRAQADADQAEVKRLTDTGSGIDQFSKKHHIAGPLMRIADIAGSAMFPGIAVNVPGTTLHHAALLGQANRRAAADEGAIGKEAQSEETEARAEELRNPQPKPKEEEWSVVPNLTGPNGEPVQQEKTSGQLRFGSGLPGVQGKQTNENPQQGYANAIADAIRNGRDPSTDPHVMAWQHAIEAIAKDPAVSAQDKDISDYLAANNLENTPANREKARGVIAQRVPAARVSVETGNARGGNAALANVPPHLVAPATAAATKAGEDYAQSKMVSDNIAQIMAAAKSGNVVAYQLLPQEGALQVTTTQGVHRINMAEIQNYGGGSAWQKMQGAFGKAATGRSIPPEVLKAMGELQQVYRNGARQKYQHALQVINQNYGANFSPIDTDETAQPQRPPNVPEGYVFKDGPRGRGWYKPNGQ